MGFSSNETMIGSQLFIIAEYPESKCSVKLYNISPQGYAPPVVSADQTPIKYFEGSIGNKVIANFTIDNSKLPDGPHVLWASCDTNKSSLVLSYHNTNKGITKF